MIFSGLLREEETFTWNKLDKYQVDQYNMPDLLYPDLFGRKSLVDGRSYG